MSLIYVVEDDENIAELIVATLAATGHNSKRVACYSELLGLLKDEIPSLILLDIMLPEISGTQIIKKLKEHDLYRDIPVIFLSARGEELDKVKGLEQGAEDYITKPFGVLELSARIKAVLRRRGEHKASDIEIDRNSKEVTVFGKLIKLSFKEFELLEVLFQNAGIVLSRDTLLDRVWGYSYAGDTTRTVDMHIKSLRQKLCDTPENPKFIETVRGYGYKFIKR